MKSSIVKSFLMVIIVFVVCFCYSISSKAEIISNGNDDLNHLLSDIWDSYSNSAVNKNANKNYIFRIYGILNNDMEELIKSSWQYKDITYELYYDSMTKLAHQIYDIAIFSNDLSKDVSMERFEKGVQGFHYSIDQICSFLNSQQIDSYSYNELQFILYLINDEVVNFSGGVFVPSGKVKHILGVAPGKKRTMKVVSYHERLHVIWDEDAKLKNEYQEKWKNLTAEEKDSVIKSLKGYSLDKEDQLVEEWFVRQLENNYFN
jgi:hypothetical protein